MASSSNPWIQQIQRAWVPMLEHSSTMDFRVFNQYFQKPIQSAVDIVVIYNDNNTLCGFGVVVNEGSMRTGGHFSTVPYWAGRLNIKIAVISNTLRDVHCTSQAQNNGLPFSWINYAQLQSPLISSLLQQSPIVSFFKNPRPSYDFKVVALFPDDPCGFGFVQIPPVATTNVEERNYLFALRVLVHQLMEIVDGGITAICGRSFAPPAGVRPLFKLPSVQPSGHYSSRIQQQQLPGWDATRSNYARNDSNFVMQHQQPWPSIRSQPTAAVIPNEDTITPSAAYMWGGQLTSSSRLFGGEWNTAAFQWPGSINAAEMQQPQSVFSQPTAAVIPHDALNIPSGDYLWSGLATSTGILPGSEPNTNQSSGSRYAAEIQHPHPLSGAYLWGGQGTSTGRLSGGEQSANQSSGTNEGLRPLFNLPSVPPSGHYSSRIQQQQLPGWDATGSNYARNDSNFVMQHQQPWPSIRSQPTAAVIPNEDTNTPSAAYMWGGQLTSSSRLFGGEWNTAAFQWPGSINAAEMQQPQSVFSQPTAAVIPHDALNIPSGDYLWSGLATSTGILPGSEPITNQSSGSRYAAEIQHPHPLSGAYLWGGHGTSTGRLSGGEQSANQSSGTNEAVLQQQQHPDSIHSRATEANILGQN